MGARVSRGLAHAHAHPHGHDHEHQQAWAQAWAGANNTFHFTHYKLDAYRVSSELADLVERLTGELPPGHHKLVDQIVRSASGAEALIAEGANRYTPKQKRQRFVEARGEAGETAAHLQRLRRLKLISEQQLMQGLSLADRLCAMLTGLIKRHS